MRRRAFVPPRQLQAPPKQVTAAVAASAAPAPQLPLAIVDCTFRPQHKKKGATADGTLVVRGRQAQLLDLALREKAAEALPAAAAAQLHAAHAAALGARAGQPGPLWLPGEEEPPEEVAVGQFVASIEDDSDAAVTEEEWQLRLKVAAEGRAGRPTDLVGAALAADNIGARMLAAMGWRPGQGLGRTHGVAQPVLASPKWDKSGLGSSAAVKRLGSHTRAPSFRRATGGAGKARGGAGSATQATSAEA